MSSFYLCMLDENWHLKVPGGNDFSQPQPLLILCHLALNSVNKRADIAKLFWENDSQSTRLKKLSDMLRIIRKISPELLQDSEDSKNLFMNVGSDVHDLHNALAKENYEKVLELYKAPFLKGIEESHKLKLKEKPLLYEWVIERRDELNFLLLDTLLNQAERLAYQSKFAESGRLAWQAWQSIDHDNLILDDLCRIHTLLLSANAPHHYLIRKEIKKLDKDAVTDQIYKHSRDAKKKFAFPSNLSLPDTTLIGRLKEIKELKDLLQDPQCRLLTILGPPGTGKTKLTTELAIRLIGYQSFIDGIYIVLLSNLHNSKAIPTAIAQTLNIDIQGNPLSDIKHFLAEKQILLFLDNYEHLVDNVHVLDELLKHCPNLTLVVTSRISLKISWERLYPLTDLPLTIEESTDKSFQNGEVTTQNSDAVKLFLEHALRKDPHFSPSKRDLEHIVTICRLVRGSPLGIVLASAWITSTSYASIIENLEANIVFDSLSQDRNERHNSIMTAFNYSWELLSEEEKINYSKTSIFSGGFTLAAGEAVLGIRTKDLMVSLISLGEKVQVI